MSWGPSIDRTGLQTARISCRPVSPPSPHTVPSPSSSISSVLLSLHLSVSSTSCPLSFLPCTPLSRSSCPLSLCLSPADTLHSAPPPAAPLLTPPSTARSSASEAESCAKSGCWIVTACGGACPLGGKAVCTCVVYAHAHPDPAPHPHARQHQGSGEKSGCGLPAQSQPTSQRRRGRAGRQREGVPRGPRRALGSLLSKGKGCRLEKLFTKAQGGEQSVGTCGHSFI